MNIIEHIVEPDRLFLVWQPQLTHDVSSKRVRRTIGEIVKENGKVVFRYFSRSDDFKEARTGGFEGYPSFRLDQAEHAENVIETFLRRLPPRKRNDFFDYLASRRLPRDFNGSDLSLLAHTGAKLPSDTFELIPDLINVKEPFEVIFEVAGNRHTNKKDDIQLNDPVIFEVEDNNPYENDAIMIKHNGDKIGYVCRPYKQAVHHWIKNSIPFTAVIERLNGKPERPLIYLFVRVG